VDVSDDKDGKQTSYLFPVPQTPPEYYLLFPMDRLHARRGKQSRPHGGKAKYSWGLARKWDFEIFFPDKDESAMTMYGPNMKSLRRSY